MRRGRVEAGRRTGEAALSGLISLRPATSGDCALIFEWANDPEARRNAFVTTQIPWETHVAWFERKLGSPELSRIFIAELRNGTAIGLIRFDREATSAAAVISFTVAPDSRGLGFGTQLLAAGTARIREEWTGLSCVIGLVKPDNVASRRAFERAGFIGRLEDEVWHFRAQLA